MYASFGHIFGGGYAAGYYSYMWAEIIEADVFARIKEQ
jgi:oligopeptidase A